MHRPSNETVLRPEDHEHFLTQGYVVVRQAVPPQILTKAIATLESDTPDPSFAPAAACTTDRVHQVIAELFGPAYPFEKRRGGNDMARPHQPNTDQGTLIAHIDDAYPTLMPNGWAIGTFIFLTKVHTHGGAFIYFSGSPQRYRQGMSQSYHSIKEVAADPQYSGAAKEFLAEPGDVLFFHHLMGYIYAQYPSKIAGGQALYVAPEADPSQALCRWGEDWPAAALGKQESVAVQAPKGGRINDLIIAAYLSDSNCAVVADVLCNETTPTQPYYNLPQDVAIADGTLQPLAYIGDTPPHHIRIFNRSPSYWMLTYLRRCKDQDHLFWGYIDWQESLPTLRPLVNAAAFDQAKSIVGLM